MRELLRVGAGGFGRETAEAARAVNAARSTWQLVGFLDDDRQSHGVLVGGLPVVGPRSCIRLP